MTGSGGRGGDGPGGGAAAEAADRVGTFEVLDLASGRASWSESCWRLLGLEHRAGADPPRYLDLVHPADRDDVEALVAEAVRTGAPTSTEHRVVRPDGAVRWVEAHLAPVPDPAGGSAVSLVGVVVDVTAAHESQRALARAEATLRMGFDRSPIGVAISDLALTITTANPAYCAILGRPVEDVVGRTSSTFIHPGDLASAVSPRRAMVDGGPDTFTSRHRVLRADGSTRWVHRTVTHVAHPAEPVFVTQMIDVTDEHLATARLAHLAHHDELTGLASRTVLTERTTEALRRVSDDRVVVCVFLDLDGFTLVNDALGHAVGDQLLVAVAARLRRVLEPGDTLARFGGDGFVLVRGGCEPAAAAAHAREVAAVLDVPVDVGGRTVTTTACVGVASGRAGDDAATLLRHADTAVTRAKARGPGQLAVFDEAMARDVAERLEVVAGLGGAVDRDELVLHYQPVVDLDDGRAVSVEALLRWQHPARGLLGPDDFVDVAERSGLIVPIGGWVLRQAVATLARWRAELPGAEDLRMAVNLSPRQLREAALPALVADLLAAHGLPPSALQLEVTESVLVDDVTGGARVLASLEAAGVGLVVDDFGTGYSSLSYLTRLPLAALKLDQSFVAALDDPDHRTRAVVTAVVGLAGALDLTLVAEGVESAAQLGDLRALGVRLAQGFLFSRALPADELEDWITEHHHRTLRAV